MMDEALATTGATEMLPDLPALLARFAGARSVALVGASNDPLKWGNRILCNITEGGFAGRIYPVNPRESRIAGLEAYPSVGALPEIPDVVLVCVPAAAASRALEETARAGVKAVVVITSGFAETGNEEAERELAEIARRRRLAMVGPNSMGYFSARVSLHAIMAGSRPARGGISFVSQSGNVGSQAMGRCHLHGAGFSLLFSIGNAAALDWADYLDFLALDEGTRVIALYLEGVRDGRRFLDRARAAATRKPVLVTKGGRSGAGAHAARSHSAALATPDGLFRGLVRQAGALLTASVEEMMDAAVALDVAPLPRGPRVGIITWGGGWGVLATDACVAAGLEVPALSEPTRAALDELLPPYWSGDNPVDLAGGLDHAAHLEALEILARDPGLDSLLVLGTLSAPDPYLGDRVDLGLAAARIWGIETAERMVSLVGETGKPMVGVSMGGVAPPPETVGKLPVYHTPDRAVACLARMVEYARILGRKTPAPPENVARDPRAAALLDAVPAGATLTEGESLDLLAACGIETVPRAQARTETEATEVARRLGFPVALKAGGIAHKTERGLVATGLRNDVEVAEAWRAIRARLDAGETAHGMLVQRMLASSREFAMGVVRDPVFGPCVMFGLGGIHAEALGDVSFRGADLSEADAEEMMDEVRAGVLLAALRGEPAVDRRALARMLVRLGRIALDFPRVAEIDVNPVLVPGGEPVAADALVILAPGIGGGSGA
ncbi:MAG: acetate--CoA ligase family protein [Acidobacteria bacterium]|nr:acetate--CoA ligase family protein [Acidobacteriota bacterium]